MVVADWGGDPTGLDCAELLAQAGCEVTLTVAATAVGESLHSYRRALYLARLYRAGVRIRHHLRLVEVTPDGGVFANLFADDVREQIAADHLVLAQGRVPAASPSARLRELGWRCATPATARAHALSKRRSWKGRWPSSRGPSDPAHQSMQSLE